MTVQAQPAPPRSTASGIDIVIPHVDGSAPGYEDLCRQHTGEFIPCQLRALGELRFVIRSLEKYAAWANIVLVVQSEAHVPAWVNRQSVRIVLHRDFIPHALLPTFHFATIAAHFHLIPGLSERYVYWEDDILAGTDLQPTDLFAPDGLLALRWSTIPILYGLGRFLGTYQLKLEDTRRALGRLSGRKASAFLYPHAPVPATRSSWTRFFDTAMQEPSFRSTVMRKSRGDERSLPTVDPLVLYANWIEQVARRHRSPYWLAIKNLVAGAFGRGFKSAKYAVVNDEARMRRNMSRLRQAGRRAAGNRDVVFFNVNDDAYDSWRSAGQTMDGSMLNPASSKLLVDTLAGLFPERSRHEIC